MPGTVVVNQPGVYLVDADGNVVSADDGTTIASHEGILIAGKDGTVLRFMRVASDGTLRIDPTGTTTQPISAAALPLPAGAATETKLEAVRALLATIDADTSTLAGVDFATQTTLATLATETKLEAVRVLIASLDGKDFATQTTLADILVDTGQIETLLGTIDADTSNLDVALSTRATEATLALADGRLTTIDAVLDSIKDTDGIKKIEDPLPAGTNIMGEVGLDLPKLEDQLPDPDSFALGARGHPHVDQKDRLVTKAQVSSDEGVFRDDFTASLESSLTGTLTFTSGKTVTGSGTAFTTELSRDSLIRLTSDSQSVAARVDQIFSDTSLSLVADYGGTASSGAATKSSWRFTAGSGMTIAQATSTLTISTGTTNASESSVCRRFHAPGVVMGLVAVDQRIANQELRIGIWSGDNSSEAVFVFDGILTNKVKVRTSSPGGTTETSTVTLPAGETTADQHEYKVDIGHESVRFFVDGARVADHVFHLALPYEHLRAGAYVENTGTPASSTDFEIDALYVSQKTVIEVKVSGALDNLRTDAAGNLQVNMAASTQALPLLVNPNYSESDGAIVANQYKRVVSYAVPDDYDGWLIRFSSYQAETAKSRLVAFKELGTYDASPDTYTPGEVYIAPQWSALIEAEVTTQVTAAGATNKYVTVTYTNHEGVTGRTGTIMVPKSSIVGSRWILTLQAGDVGLTSIQDVTCDWTGDVGVFQLYGNIQLAYHNDLSNTIQLETNYQPGAIAFPSGTKLAVEYAGATTSKDRLFDMLIQLVAAVEE